MLVYLVQALRYKSQYFKVNELERIETNMLAE